MKKLRKYFLPALLSVILLIAFRELGPYDFFYYDSQRTFETHLSWNHYSNSSEFNQEAPYSADVPRQFSKVPVVVMYKGNKLYEDTGELAPLIVEITEILSGPLWTPLYKSTNFKANAHVSYFIPWIGTGQPRKKYENFRLTCEGTVEGTVSILGFCSHKKAMAIIKDIVARDLAQQTRKYLISLD